MGEIIVLGYPSDSAFQVISYPVQILAIKTVD
jgi:hypothetical protein